MLLKDKVAVVTGSGRGIGRGIAMALAREGAKVVVNDVGCEVDGRGGADDPAQQVVNEIKALGSDAVPNYDSVSDFAGAERIIKTATDKFGRIDILVNNAGIVRDRSLAKMSEDDFDVVLGVHLKGSFNCGRHALPIMKEQGYGRVINITSSAGLRGNFGQTNYGAAKAGIMGLTLVWAIEHEKYGITVNAMAPSGMTRMTGTIPGMDKDNPPPEMNPELNGPADRVPRLGESGAGEWPDLRPPRLRLHHLPATTSGGDDVQARRSHGERDRCQLQRRLPRTPAADRHSRDADESTTEERMKKMRDR